MESDILQPLPRGRGLVHYVDDGEFVRLVLSRRKLERVSERGHDAPAIRDVRTGEVYELVPGSGSPEPSARTPSRGAHPA